MSDFVASIDETIRSLTLFERGQSMLVGVSGGVDSMALLHVLNRLAPEPAWRLVVAHFNHRLRGRASDADEAFVRKSAKALGLEFVTSGADVKRFARRHKLSVEMAARKMRHNFFARTCARFGIGTVALAHHADDQVELFFLRLLRGAGGDGLAGMKWIGPSPSAPAIRLVRPFLQARKEELRAFAQQEGIAHREDATNADLDHQRNRIRHQLLPLLEAKYQPALAKVVPRVMEIIGAESDFLAKVARAWLAECGSRTRLSVDTAAQQHRSASDGFMDRKHGSKTKGASHDPIEPRVTDSKAMEPSHGLTFEQGRDVAGRFEALPVALQRRVMQLELARLDVAPEFELIERLRSSVEETMTVSPSLAIWRDQHGRLHSCRPAKFHFAPNAIALDLAAQRGHADFSGLQLEWQICPWKRGAAWRPMLKGQIEQFDARKVGSPIFLRHWRPGDRFQPIGLREPVKVQDLFTNARIPRTLRHSLVLAATAEHEIFWVEGLRISECFKINRRTTSSLCWSWRRTHPA